MSSSEQFNLAISALAGIFGFLVASKMSEKKEDTVQHGGGTPIELISGPSVVYVGKYNGVKYILFGDIHTDPVKNTCNVEPGCSGYFDNPLTLSKDYSEWTFTADRVPTIVPDSKCYEVSYLLTKIFEIAYANKKNIDFYFETDFDDKGKSSKKQREKYTTTLRKIDNVFHKCLQLDKKRCKYFPYVKLHYVDVRLEIRAAESKTTHNMFLIQCLQNTLLNNYKFYLENPTLFFLIISFLKHVTTDSESSKLFNIVLNSDEYDLDMKKFITESSRKVLVDLQYDAIPKNFSQILRDCYDQVIQRSKKRNGKIVSIIKAQLDMITDQSIAQKIKKFVLETKEYQLEQVDLQKKINDLSQLYKQSDIRFNLPQIKQGIFDIISVVIDTEYMDAYLLGRMFRSFDSDSNVKIVYAGEFHIERYVEFFKDYLGVSFDKHSSIEIQSEKEEHGQWKCVESPFKTIEEFT